MDHTPANRFQQSVSDNEVTISATILTAPMFMVVAMSKLSIQTKGDNGFPGSGETMTNRFSLCNQPHGAFRGTSFVPHPETSIDNDSRSREEQAHRYTIWHRANRSCSAVSASPRLS